MIFVILQLMMGNMVNVSNTDGNGCISLAGCATVVVFWVRVCGCRLNLQFYSTSVPWGRGRTYN